MLTFPKTLDGRFRFLNVIGNGGEASVAKYEQLSNGKLVAIKEYPSWNFLEDEEIKEFTILTKISHENVVKCYDIIKDAQYIYLVLEFIKGVTLDRWASAFGVQPDVPELLCITKQIFAALYFLHMRHVIHRDIKLENIMYNDGTKKITLIDFGSAKETQFDPAKTFCGTLVHMSPEELDGKQYCSKTDIWAAGITIFRLICGVLPFDGPSVVRDIMTGNFVFPQNIDEEFKKIICSCLTVDRAQRYTAEQILFHFFPFARETLQSAMCQVVSESTSYRICSFGAKHVISECKMAIGGYSTFLQVESYELSAEKTLPTPSFFRQLSGCFFSLANNRDREIANIMLERQLETVNIVFTCYENDVLRPKMNSKQIEVKLYEENIEEEILLYLNTREPGHNIVSGIEVENKAQPRQKYKCC